MRCGRCQNDAETQIKTRNFGTEDVCLACAVVVLADRQCDNIEQPPQPPGIVARVNLMRAEYGSNPLTQ